ncbi:MAG: LysR family transcriptional regulator [Nitriliruptoraceae bacterium]
MTAITDLDLLSAFVAVAEERHFRRAAERLHLAQPVVSRRIQRLERDTGVQLLERSTRQVSLTDAGTGFLDDARRLLHDADLAVARAQRVAQGVLGRLSIGFVESVAFELLAPLLAQLERRVPDVTLELRELSTEQQLTDLHADVDVAIVRELGEHELSAEHLRGRHLLTERLHVALPERHRLAGRSTLQLAELADLPFIIFPRPPVPRLHDHLLAVCARADFHPDVVAHAAQYPTMLAMVAAARGLALVPACARAIRPRGVRLVPLVDAHATTSLSLAWQEPAPAALDTFIDAASAVAHAHDTLREI